MHKMNFSVSFLFVNIIFVAIVHAAPADNSSTAAPKEQASARDDYTCTYYGYGCSTKCLAGDTLVSLTNGKHIRISELQAGDQLLTSDGKTIFATEMMMMLDQNAFGEALFHTITTASGHNVSLTGFHLIPTVGNDNSMKFVAAKQLKIGDAVYVMENGEMISSVISNIILEMKAGYYGPLTTSGTFLGNGVMTSCYANVQSHEMAHTYMSILRAYYWSARALFMDQPFGSSKMEGIHAIPKMLYELALFVYPSALHVA